MNKNKRKLNKLAIVSKKGQLVVAKEYYLNAKSLREGDVFRTAGGYYIAVISGHLRWLDCACADSCIITQDMQHDHWLGSHLTLVGINFSSLKEVAEVFL